MKRRAVPGFTRLGRSVRGLWPDRNPLRRTSDRLEAAISVGILLAFLICAPLLALAVSSWTYGVGLRTADAEHASWHQVTAVSLTSAPTDGYGGYAAMVQARWLGPDGKQHTGEVSVPAGSKAGTRVTVWVDRAGHVTGAPLDTSMARGEAVLASVIAPAVLGVALLGLWGTAHKLIDRHRLAGWDADWRATGPQWSPRR